MDLGYYEYHLFHRIDQQGGFFIGRLKRQVLDVTVELAFELRKCCPAPKITSIARLLRCCGLTEHEWAYRRRRVVTSRKTKRPGQGCRGANGGGVEPFENALNAMFAG